MLPHPLNNVNDDVVIDQLPTTVTHIYVVYDIPFDVPIKVITRQSTRKQPTWMADYISNTTSAKTLYSLF